MARNLIRYWLLVTLIAICVVNVACKPSIKEDIKINKPSIKEDVKRNIFENWFDNNDDNTTVDGDSPVRRPGSTDVEDESISSGNHSAGSVFYDAADWVKEAEQWSFKGGDWGLVTLPNDDHPDIPAPPVPGPVLIAEGDSMGKVIVSRSEENLENLTLHFSYFLSNNPENPPVLEVYQIQDETLSERVSVEATYGEWTTSTVSLPYSGNFEINFIGQRIVETNEIVLDDIVLRGYYMGDEAEEENEVYDYVDTDKQVTNEYVEDKDEYTQINDTVVQDVSNDTQTFEESYLNAYNDTQATKEGDEDVVLYEGDQDVENDTQTAEEGDEDEVNDTQISEEGDQDVENDTETFETQVDDEKDEDEENVTQGTGEDDQEIKENDDSTTDDEDYWEDIYKDEYSGDGDDYANDNGWFFNNWLNSNGDDSNSTKDSNIIWDSIDANEVSEISGEIEDTGPGGAMIMFWTVSVLGFVLLGFLYWRRRGYGWGNGEKTIFNRATAGQNDFDRLMYSDVPYEDDGGNGKNYKSFD